MIGELFGEDRIRPEYQLGLHTSLVPDRLELDGSWGGHTAGAFLGAGWAVGIAWTRLRSSERTLITLLRTWNVAERSTPC